MGIGTERASSAQRGALHRRWQLARAEGNCRGTVWRPRALPTPLPSRRGPASPWAWEFTGTRFFRRRVYHRWTFGGFEKTWFAIRSQKLGPCIMMYDVSQHQKKNNFFLEFTHVFFYSSSPAHCAQCARRVRRRTAAMGDPPSRTIREDDLLFWSQKMLGLDARPGGARWRCCQTCALRAPCWARRLRKPAADATTPLPMRAHTHLHQCWRTFVMACSWSGSCSAC